LNYQYQANGPFVLKDLSLTINKGERISIVGKNGAGKSTLAKALTKFIDVDGLMLWKGENIGQDSVKERAERIGYVLQNPNQMISQTMIFDEVALGLRLRNIDEREIKERVEDTLKVTGLFPFRNWPISALSYGQKKRVTIASILVLKPEIILLDEPTAGQDYRNYTRMLAFLEELNQLGHTIVMITHDMHLMMEYSDRAIVLVDGEILADDKPSIILNNEELRKKAHLKETSIFQLARRVGAKDPTQFAERLIQTERKEKD